MIFKNKHGPLSGEALRRALQQARDPEHNYTLFSLINGGLRVLEEDYKRRGHVWPPVHLEGVLARVHEIERARRQELAPAAAETMDPKCEWTEWAGGNHMALFELLQEQRARNHDGLLRALLAAGAQTYDFLVKALERRRANDHDTLQKALLGVKDYDSFLKVLEDVVADDHDSLLRAIIDNDLGDVDAFNIASVAQNWKIREAVSTALVEFYCGQIAAA
jgi:hypothetical protein